MPAVESPRDATRFSERQSSFGAAGPPRVNVGRTERVVSAFAGGALMVYGLARRSWSGGTAALAGAVLVYRGATGHCPGYGALGVNRVSRSGPATAADEHSDTRHELGGSRGIHASASVTIARPVAEVYRFWRDLENLPRFMPHLTEVAMREKGMSHWVAAGPAGMPVEWDARIINDVDNKIIGWQSLEGSMISTAGSVNFRETGQGTTVHVRLQYQPPGGALGAAVARLFGKEPNQTIAEDLERLKGILEKA